MAIKPFYSIPLPTAIPYGKGIDATNGPNGTVMLLRLTKPEKDKIKAAAASIGVSMGTFARRLMNDMADEILAQQETEIKDE